MNVLAPILSPLGKAAVEYARRGWKVFPLQPGTKIPFAGTTGHKMATSDEETVRAMWMDRPDANIGVNLEASGLVALDVDSYKLDCEFATAFAGFEMPKTLVQRSASGGRHYIFNADINDVFPSNPCKGVEIKHKGYIVIEPSTFNGGQYRFETDDEPAPAPDWLPRKPSQTSKNVVHHPASIFGNGLDLGPNFDGANDTLRRLVRVLESAPNTLNREDWVKLGLCVKNELGTAGRDAFLSFSARYPSSDPKEDARMWDTLKPDGGVGAGTAFELLGSDGRNAHLAPFNPPATARQKPDQFGDACFRLLSSTAFVDGFTSPDYTLDGVLRRGWLYSLTAPTGSGKTAVTLRIAEAVAMGEVLLDTEVAQGSVLYLAGENPDDVRSRLIASLDQRGVEASEVPMYFVDGVFSIRDNLAQISSDLEVAGIELALVVVDTLAAYFDGDDPNNNAQQQHFATTVLRSLTRLPGNPTVIVPAHPVKNATKSNLVPMGGSALLNQVDGNLTAWRTDKTIEVHWQGKFRGAPFEPIHFELVNCTCDQLIDSRGRHMPTVLANPLTIQRGMALVKESEVRENRVLELINANPKISERAIADVLGSSPSTANRIKNRLFERKWIKSEGRELVLTAEGRKVIAK